MGVTQPNTSVPGDSTNGEGPGSTFFSAVVLAFGTTGTLRLLGIDQERLDAVPWQLAWTVMATLTLPVALLSAVLGTRLAVALSRWSQIRVEGLVGGLARSVPIALVFSALMVPARPIQELANPSQSAVDPQVPIVAVTLAVGIVLMMLRLFLGHSWSAVRRRAKNPGLRRRILAAFIVPACVSTLMITPPVNSFAGPAPAVARSATCDQTTQSRSYDVAAINVHLVYNRWGQGNDKAMIYVLQQDKAAVRDWHEPLGTTSSNRRLRPRPLVIRANEGECVAVRFTNELDVDQHEGLPNNPRASMSVRGVPYDVQHSGGGHVGYNDSSSVGIGETTTYYWTATGEGIYFFNDSAMPAGSEADGGSLSSGLYGAFVVEPAGSTWTDPVSGKALYTGTRDQSGELYIQADITPPAGRPFREAIQLAQDELPLTSTFAFNYGSEDTEARTAEGCSDCVGEETSLSSWVYGDPALVKLASGFGPWKPGTAAGEENCGLGTPGFETDSCFTSNVVHTYKGDPTKFRFGMAGVKETHVFHMHAHQWLAEDKDVGQAGSGPTTPGPGAKPESSTIDSQTFGPMEMFTADLLFGAGSKNGTVGDSIFHCHLYPHFVSGFWGLLRVHDVKEDGSGATPDGVKVPALVALPDRSSPVAPSATNPGYPRFIPGEFGWRAPQPPLGITRDGVPEQRFVAGKALASGSPAVQVEESVMNRMSGGASKPGAPFNDPCPSGAREVTYNVSAIQLKAVYNERGDFDAQARILVLDRDVDAVLSGRKKPEPIFARVNAGDCINWKLTNRIPNWFGNDAFVQLAQTNMFGQHIHLVKFDVMASDGATNGWNYQQAAFSDSQDKFNEQIAANPASCTTTKCRLDLPDDHDPLTDSSMIAPGQTITERWYADYELRTVFTHDHHFAALDQNRGEYGAVVVEPSGMDFRNPVTGTWYQPINDPAHGTPCGQRCPGGAASATMDVIGPGADDDFREFGLAIADFVSLTRAGGDPQNPADAVNPPLAPETFPDDDPGVMSVNYRNAPLELRQTKNGKRVDPAYMFSSHVFGDPATPVLQTYDGDNVRVRLIQGSQEEQHVLNVHGVRWKREPDDPQSHVVDSLTVGVSEAFNFEVPRFGCTSGVECRGDYLYTSTASDDMWAGMWGLLRVNGGRVPDLLPLPDNPQNNSVAVPSPDPGALEPPARLGPGNPCPTDAPKRVFDVVAMQTDLVYNDAGDHDPYGLVYALAKDEAAIRAGLNPEPLVLRAHEGDCIEVNLRNTLTPALQKHQGEGDSPLPGNPDAAVRAPGLRVSLHAGLLKYDVRGSDGAAVGYNRDQTVAPGDSMLYRWYAEDVTPGEIGAVNLTDFGDVLGHRHHGLFAGLIVEPRNTRWTDQKTGAPLESGAAADIRWPGREDFRESVVFFQDGLNLRTADGALIADPEDHPPLPGEPAGGLDAEDTGEKAFSYRSEPFRNRLGYEPVSNHSPPAADLAEVYDSHKHGDPATPIIRAYEDDPLRVRVMVSGDKPRQHAFDLGGHSFRTSPDDPGSREVGTVSGLGPNMVVNAEMGRTNSPGDYLFGCMVGFFHRSGGLWGMLRVYPAPSSQKALSPSLVPEADDPRSGGHPLLPLELDSVSVTAFHDRNGNGIKDPGEPWVPDAVVEASREGHASATATTDQEGAAHLSTLPGTYRVTASTAGAEPLVAAASVTTNGNNDVRPVRLGLRDPSAVPDPTATIRARTFHDGNRNGTRDANERGLSGVEVAAARTGQVLATARSGSTGFADLVVEPGSYDLKVTPPSGYRIVAAPGSVTSGAAGSVTEVDVALAPKGSGRARLKVITYADRDGDGRRDRGEPGAGRTRVTVKSHGEVVARTVTDAKGRVTVRLPATQRYLLVLRPPRALKLHRAVLQVRAGRAGSIKTVFVGMRTR